MRSRVCNGDFIPPRFALRRTQASAPKAMYSSAGPQAPSSPSGDSRECRNPVVVRWATCCAQRRLLAPSLDGLRVPTQHNSTRFGRICKIANGSARGSLDSLLRYGVGGDRLGSATSLGERGEDRSHAGSFSPRKPL